MPSTASQWLADNAGDVEGLAQVLLDNGVSVDFLTEYPNWMKQEVANHLADTFKQPYWDDIHKTFLGDAEKYLGSGLRDGKSIVQMANEIAESYAGQGSAEYAKMRATTIARTESTNALNGARKAGMDRLTNDPQLMGTMRPVWLSVLGTTTRDTHAYLDGVPADKDGMWVLAGYKIPWPGHISLPPSERCNCFPAGTLVQGDFVGAQRGWYEGIFTEIILRKGRRVTVTPQHPIVTSKGLAPASSIQPGQKVMTYNAEVDITPFMASSGNEIENKPAPIEQVFEAFFLGTYFDFRSATKVKRAQINDFYGDGKFFHGNVDIVRTNWKLLKDGKFGQFEKCGNSILVFENRELLQKLGFGSSALNINGVDLAPSSFPSLAQSTLNHIRRFEITPTGSLSIGMASNFDTSLNKSARQDGTIITSFLRESLQRHSRFVAFDDVVQVRNFYSAGHVYDLQSKYGLIVASDPHCNMPGGIVNSNCQCTIVMELGMQDPEALDLIGEYNSIVEGENKALNFENKDNE